MVNFQIIFLKINLFYMHQYTMTSEIYSWNQISGRFRAWHMVWMFVACTSCSKWIFIFFSFLQYQQTMPVSVFPTLIFNFTCSFKISGWRNVSPSRFKSVLFGELWAS
jgi:hypothetical protein